MIEAVISRLTEAVTELDNRVQGAGALSALLKRKSLPAGPRSAFVLYGGLAAQGGAAESAGAFRQSVREQLTIVLCLRATDGDGFAVIDEVKTLQAGILRALCGWAPDAVLGAFELVRGFIISFTGGVLFYQIDLALTDQLRITE